MPPAKLVQCRNAAPPIAPPDTPRGDPGARLASELPGAPYTGEVVLTAGYSTGSRMLLSYPDTSGMYREQFAKYLRSNGIHINL